MHDKANGDKVAHVSYLCGSYARSGKSACSQHKIKSSVLSQLVRLDIRLHTKCAVENEQILHDELMKSKLNQTAQQQKQKKPPLRRRSNLIPHSTGLTKLDTNPHG